MGKSKRMSRAKRKRLYNTIKELQALRLEIQETYSAATNLIWELRQKLGTFRRLRSGRGI
jgi:hypothetical protein